MQNFLEIFFKMFSESFHDCAGHQNILWGLLIFNTDLENCQGGVILKGLYIGNTNIFGDMSIITKRTSSGLCCFSCVIWRSNLVFVALSSLNTLLIVNLCLDRNKLIKNYMFRGNWRGNCFGSNLQGRGGAYLFKLFAGGIFLNF